MIYLNDNNLEDLIKNGDYLVDFYAEWCGPCKMLMPVLESIQDKVNIIKVDIDKFPELTSKYRIMSVPTMIYFKDGEKKDELIGFHTKDEILELIN